MPDSFTINTEDIAAMGREIMNVPHWAPEFIEGNMRTLGGRIRYVTREILKRHRYTGALDESVEAVYDTAMQRLEVGPTAMRGQYSAGIILERGTQPIANAPFGPIAAWAESKGLPAGPVWWKIKTKGVSPHPWLGDVIADGRTKTAIEHTAKRIGMQLVARPLQRWIKGGVGTVDLGPETSFGG